MLFKKAGFIIPAAVIAIAILNIFEPIILPAIKSTLPFLADWILAASSGRLVPNAASVRPITYVVIPKNIAISVAPWIKRCDPYSKRASEVTKYKNKIVILSAIDNLIKGGAGQAVQNLNMKFNFPLKTAL